MTAWSANVSSRRIWSSENGRTSFRRSRIAPTASPLLSSGVESIERKPKRGWDSIAGP